MGVICETVFSSLYDEIRLGNTLDETSLTNKWLPDGSMAEDLGGWLSWDPYHL